ncbi:hypothetical protein LCGC14_1373480, partial [marine sediment metagenome]
DLPLIYDISYKGTIGLSGEVEQLWGVDALNNAVRMWLASFSGEIVRQPGKGGYLMKWLMKPMNELSIDRIRMGIRNGLNQDFTPFLEILSLEVVPNYEHRYWIIILSVYSNDLKIRTDISVNIKNRV